MLDWNSISREIRQRLEQQKGANNSHSPGIDTADGAQTASTTKDSDLVLNDDDDVEVGRHTDPTTQSPQSYTPCDQVELELELSSIPNRQENIHLSDL